MVCYCCSVKLHFRHWLRLRLNCLPEGLNEEKTSADRTMIRTTDCVQTCVKGLIRYNEQQMIFLNPAPAGNYLAENFSKQQVSPPNYTDLPGIVLMNLFNNTACFLLLVSFLFGQEVLADQSYYILDPEESGAQLQSTISSPADFLGFEIGDRAIRHNEAILYFRYPATIPTVRNSHNTERRLLEESCSGWSSATPTISRRCQK